jgi:hypothetical protein
MQYPTTKSIRHPALAGWSWGAVIVEAAYRGSVIAYAYHCYPPSPLDVDHFARNVGNRLAFVMIDVGILIAGAFFGLLGLCTPNRKHWAAATGLVANLIAISSALDIHWWPTITRAT